jgi:hypothetical protein
MNMITATKYKCSDELIHRVCALLDDLEYPVILNEPVGDFFTDPWSIKSKFQNTVWHDILSTLTQDIGQARIIKLDPATCYHCHADIDDRYHLNLQGEQCYLVDLDEQKMHKIEDDGIWYSMDASRIHSAVNFGRYARYQIVVRKLLPKNHLSHPVNIKIFAQGLAEDDARFVFDNTISSWLNTSCKNLKIANFKNKDHYIDLSVEKDYLASLEKLTSQNIKVEIYD